MNVLDHGYVKLVDHMGDDQSIVQAARVSYAGDLSAKTPEQDEKLIRYLVKNKHTSPFEAVVFKFEVKAPIFVMRQWQRHRTWSYNEISARYTELDADFYVPELENITTQSTDNKQMRTSEQHPHARWIRNELSFACTTAFIQYKRMLDAGCPRELARIVLSLAAYTRMYATVDLHNLMHFIRLREHPHAQWEMRQYAQALKALIQPIVPIAVTALQEIE